MARNKDWTGDQKSVYRTLGASNHTAEERGGHSKKVDKITLICCICKNVFNVHPYRKDTAKYCSKQCAIRGLVRGHNKKICAVSGCNRVTKSSRSNYCNLHYRRQLRHGDPLCCIKSPNGDRKRHVLYPIWVAMNRRCKNPNCREYKYYGERGIKVCERWQGAFGFDNFLTDMGERPDETRNGKRSKWTLDRIDNSGNYEPTNCRWSTMSEQCRNRREENMVYRNNKNGKQCRK